MPHSKYLKWYPMPHFFFKNKDEPTHCSLPCEIKAFRSMEKANEIPSIFQAQFCIHNMRIGKYESNLKTEYIVLCIVMNMVYLLTFSFFNLSWKMTEKNIIGTFRRTYSLAWVWFQYYKKAASFNKMYLYLQPYAPFPGLKPHREICFWTNIHKDISDHYLAQWLRSSLLHVHWNVVLVWSPNLCPHVRSTSDY